MTQPVILVVDDDDRLRELLEQFLADHFKVLTAANAREAKDLLRLLVFDAMVLDVMMPGQSGFSLSKELSKSHPRLPVLLLTAMGEAANRIAGLQTGAADYLTKPFEPEELLLRLENIMRRGADTHPAATMVHFGKNTFDLNRMELRKNDKIQKISTAEGTLLKALSQASGQVLSRRDLKEVCHITGNDRTIDVQITRLRKKIESDPGFPKYLQTIRGKGYVLHLDG